MKDDADLEKRLQALTKDALQMRARMEGLERLIEKILELASRDPGTQQRLLIHLGQMTDAFRLGHIANADSSEAVEAVLTDTATAQIALFRDAVNRGPQVL